ncbi:MAG: hypothetical protein ACE5IG_02955 [Dehalococcoidia bacterium]
MAYFLIAVSTKTNLDLCLKYALAGVTNSRNGLWAYVDIEEGDYVSFLYGAKAFNLYQVVEKKAIRNAQTAPPWPSIFLGAYGKTYYFPFRLQLKPVRSFEESLVRAEFAYVAENLLLRGGYWRTHFQADQTTLQAVSQMGTLTSAKPSSLAVTGYPTFEPQITWDKTLSRPPEVFLFIEQVLQSLLRKWLMRPENLATILESMDLRDLDARQFETLGEKAFPEGHADLLVKETVPIGTAKKIVIEVKQGRAQPKDLDQLTGYMKELGAECLGSLFVARDFSAKTLREAKGKSVLPMQYSFGELHATKAGSTFRYTDLQNNLRISLP